VTNVQARLAEALSVVDVTTLLTERGDQ